MSFIGDLISGIEKTVLSLLTGLLSKAQKNGSVSAEDVQGAINTAKSHLSEAKSKAARHSESE